MPSPGSRRAVLLAAAAALTLASGAACATTSSPSAAGSATIGCGSVSTLSLYHAGRLTVATDSPAYDPWFEDNDPANGKGFESAVAYAVAAQLGFRSSQVAWVIEPFDSSYAPGAKDFDFDINEVSITADRAKAVDFSTGYYTVNQGVLVLDGSKYAGATSLADLKGARIGVQVATTSYQAVVDEIKPNRQPDVYNTTDDEISALKDGQVDAIVTDMPTVYYLASAELNNGKILGQFSYDGGSSAEQFGLLLQKNSKLTSCVDQAIAALTANGKLQQITEQWLSTSTDVPELKS
jgi:polar amino acid transport system substrate-binding protein